MLTSFDKALVGLLVPLTVFLLAHFGFKADEGFVSALGVVLTPVVVWLVPNK